MVLKAGIIPNEVGDTFTFEHHTDSNEGRDAFILPVEGATGTNDLVAFILRTTTKTG
jgi:hypothetical protein